MTETRLWFESSSIRDDGQFLCLTDMWRAAGSDPSRQPAEWARQEATQRFIAYVSQDLGNDQILRREHGNPRAGEGGSLWAHWQLGMAYAQYLSPAFHAWCNDVVRKVMGGEITNGEQVTALATAVTSLTEAVREIADRQSKLENNQAALWSHISQGGYIARARFEALRSEWRTLADVEVMAGRWKNRRAALADILREMREATEWGSKGKPWVEMPAWLEPAARAVLRRRMKDVTRGGGPGGGSRQMSLLRTIASSTN